MSIVSAVHESGVDAPAIQQAAALLRSGELIALPTETVYGLAANAFDPKAVEKIFILKQRPAENPIIVHVCELNMARECVAAWPDSASALAKAFWPGPLTIVLPKSPRVPSIVTAGGQTVGIRWPNHPVAQAVLEACGFPLAAPSANLSGELSPTTAEHVNAILGERVRLILDGGPCEIGIESTVVDLTVTPARVLRPGMIHEESLIAVLGALQTGTGSPEATLKSPGLLLKHYSPKARVLLWNPNDAPQLEQLIQSQHVRDEHVHLFSRGILLPGQTRARVCSLPNEPRGFAKALYAELHRADAQGAQLIIVEAVPIDPEWRGIADRLRRAAA